MSNQNSDHGSASHNSASLFQAHLSRNLSPSLLSENFSKNSLVSFNDPQIAFYFGNNVSPEMLAQMQKGNQIASEHLGVAKRQLATSVALVQIELMKLQSQLLVDASKLRQEVVANYDRVFVYAQGKDAADRLFVYSSMHALALLGMKLKSLYKTRDFPIDLSMDIAIIMLHASPQEQEALVQSFVDEYFLGFNASGSFHDALNNLLEEIEWRVAEPERAQKQAYLVQGARTYVTANNIALIRSEDVDVFRDMMRESGVLCYPTTEWQREVAYQLSDEQRYAPDVQFQSLEWMRAQMAVVQGVYTINRGDHLEIR